MPYDGEVLGIDSDGTLLQWDADKEEVYNCGETIEEFGEDQLTPQELETLGKVPA